MKDSKRNRANAQRRADKAARYAAIDKAQAMQRTASTNAEALAAKYSKEPS